VKTGLALASTFASLNFGWSELGERHNTIGRQLQRSLIGWTHSFHLLPFGPFVLFVSIQSYICNPLWRKKPLAFLFLGGMQIGEGKWDGLGKWMMVLERVECNWIMGDWIEIE
jgi:hypothetical protein